MKFNKRKHLRTANGAPLHSHRLISLNIAERLARFHTICVFAFARDPATSSWSSLCV